MFVSWLDFNGREEKQETAWTWYRDGIEHVVG